MNEDQIKAPTGRHRRAQSLFPSSFHRSKSFGGVTNGPKKRSRKKYKSIAERIENALENEAPAIRTTSSLNISVVADDVRLDAQQGVLYVNGDEVDGLDNHANILKHLVAWFVSPANASEKISFEAALQGLAEMVRKGVKFD